MVGGLYVSNALPAMVVVKEVFEMSVYPKGFTAGLKKVASQFATDLCDTMCVRPFKKVPKKKRSKK